MEQDLTTMHDTGEARIERINAMLNTSQHQPVQTTVSASAIYNLRDELTAIHAYFLHEAQAKNIDFTVSIADDMPVAFWDMESLRAQVFNTLLSNAICHTPAGGKVALIAEKYDDYNLLLRIGDTGSGLSATAVRSSLFLRHQKSGTGLGNALSGIAAHRGTLRLTDTREWTTVFEIKLPLYTLCIQ